MDPKPPADDGSYPGEIKYSDGVVWTWNGVSWTRGIQLGVLQKLEFRPEDYDPDEADDHG